MEKPKPALGRPSETNAKVFVTLFPACASTGTKPTNKFDPTDDCVAGDAHRRKKKQLHLEKEGLRG